jgi:hypothetical protein
MLQMKLKENHHWRSVNHQLMPTASNYDTLDVSNTSYQPVADNVLIIPPE